MESVTGGTLFKLLEGKQLSASLRPEPCRHSIKSLC